MVLLRSQLSGIKGDVKCLPTIPPDHSVPFCFPLKKRKHLSRFVLSLKVLSIFLPCVAAHVSFNL